MTIFTDDFFPTPAEVVHKMLAGIDKYGLDGADILDPSAGNGAILDVIDGIYRYGRARNLYAIEVNPELRAILQEKRHNVIDTDFLEYDGQFYFDFILMNPPFSEGAKHLLKAWDIGKGALIKCLLNAETIRNPHTTERKRLCQLIDQYGEVKELGQCFKNAERPTNVEVVLVTLQTIAPQVDFSFDGIKLETAPKEWVDLADLSSQLAPYDVFESYEQQHKAAMIALADLVKAYQRLDYYCKPLMTEYQDASKLLKDSISDNPRTMFNKFSRKLLDVAWSKLFGNTKLASITTSAVSKEINSLRLTQKDMAFTAKNMYELFNMLFESKEKITVSCILETFDKLTKYHHDNREYVEGWKTNSAYKVKRKFILPYMISQSGSYLSQTDVLGDIDKAMCFIAGRKFEEITTITRAVEIKREVNKCGCDLPFGVEINSSFFKLRIFKKGTMHFEFHDDNIWQEFNRIVAKERRWLPEETKQGVYDN